MATIEAGTVVRIRGLKSAAGQKLNGSRAAVIRFVESEGEGRWQVRAEMESEPGVTKALKRENLTPSARLELPTGPDRGNASMMDMENLVPKLCELLLYYKGGGPHNYRGDFQPSEIMFTGYGSMAFTRMGESNFMCFTPVQLEQMGGVLGLGNICKEAEEPGTESVLFGLLEGDQMYVDVLIQTMHWTGKIIEDGPDIDNPGFHGPPTELTPDQDSKPYTRTMAEGPVAILHEMARYCFASALWAALPKSEFYHLLVQRLLRWTAREAQDTHDGRVLGKKARKILSSMFPDIAETLSRPVTVDVADSILKMSPDVLTEPARVSVENVQGLFV